MEDGYAGMIESFVELASLKCPWRNKYLLLGITLLLGNDKLSNTYKIISDTFIAYSLTQTPIHSSLM